MLPEQAQQFHDMVLLASLKPEIVPVARLRQLLEQLPGTNHLARESLMGAASAAVAGEERFAFPDFERRLEDYAKMHMPAPQGSLEQKQKLASRMCIAVIDSDGAEIRRLVKEEGASVTFRNADGVAALDMACIRADASMVSLLIELGADVNARRSGRDIWMTPLHSLVQGGDFHEPPAIEQRLECLRILVAAGADKDAVGPKGFRVLHSAIDGTGDPDRGRVVDLLLRLGADPSLKSAPGPYDSQKGPQTAVEFAQDNVPCEGAVAMVAWGQRQARTWGR